MTTPVQQTYQGIAFDPQGVNPGAFFKNTRRKRYPEAARNYLGLGQTETLPIRKSDIMSLIRLRFVGNLAVVPGTGAVATTSQWPYNLFKNVKLTANGQTNLIDCSGLHLKAREFMSTPDLNDRGISRSVNGVTITQGSMSKNSENWGVGQGQAGIGAGNYPVDIEIVIPVAEDEKDLTGAIFCQTATTDINAVVQYANPNDLFTLTNNATATLTGQIIMETEKFSIPVVNGLMIVPDLGLFHSLTQTTIQAVSNGENQIRLLGQGAGKQLLRTWFRTLNGAAQNPLQMNATNYGNLSWMYSTNERPETYQDGTSLRQNNEWSYGTDLGGIAGIGCHDFAAQNAFRDTVDMGQTSELRLAVTVNNGVTLVNPLLEYVQESVFSAAA